MTWLAKAGFATLALLGSVLGAAWAFAPYLPSLVWEGSPSLYRSDRASYALVQGAESLVDISDPRATDTLYPKLQEQFAASQGSALLLAVNGKLLLEHYAAGVDHSTQFNSFSMVKSLVGALVFRAVAEGELQSLDQTLEELLPEVTGLKNLTIRRLLDMRAGIHFDSRTASFGAPGSVKDSDTFPNPFGPLARLHYQGVDTILAGLTMDDQLSDEFNYQNVSTAILGAVLERVYKQPLEVLLSDKIWKPAGAATAQWRRPQDGRSVSAYCCLFATAHDWIRVGVFFNNNGRPDAPFLPDHLWRDFMGLDVDPELRRVDHYGGHTLHNVLDRPGEALQGPFTYFMGQNGQILYMMPDKGLVAYRAGGSYQLLHSTLYGAWNSAHRAP